MTAGSAVFNRVVSLGLILGCVFTMPASFAASVVVNTLTDEDNGNTSSIANLIATPGGHIVA
ncbi:MAG: hypothetical protein GC168_04760 [Candidatus Hydrogenedens sp.]|nr:hypothetical protein [Candidatus Hydrogenedens sp.]